MMSEEDKKILHDNRPGLVDNITMVGLITELLSLGAINDRMKEVIEVSLET